MEMEVIPPVPPDPPNNLQQSATKRRLDDSSNDTNPKKTITNTEMAAASIQTIYTHPLLVVGIHAYNSTDKGPFVVQVSRSEPDPAAGTSIRPIKFGQFLHQNKICNICVDGVKRVGRNKISIEFKTAPDANKFLENPLLEQHKYNAVIPTYNITRMGLVRDVPVDFSMDEFVESLDLPRGCGEVLKARRLNRKSINDDGKITWLPTQTVVLTFHGQLLPDRIFSFHTSMRVETYQYPTIQCLNCCRFGHIKAQCRSKPRCFKCTHPHSGDVCEGTEPICCLYCSGKHFSIDKCCPEQDRQKSVKMVMAQDGISYEEASYRFPQVYKRYTEVAQEPPQPPISQHSSSLGNPSATHSYAKTVYSSPRPKATLGKSYDKTAHQAIIAPEPSTMPNGCALQNPPPSINNNLLEILISLIISIISQNNSSLPSDVASKLSSIISLLGQYGSSHCSTVEQSKSSSQET